MAVIRLVDCHPKFWTAGPDGRHGLGLSFDCPLCVKEGKPSIRSIGPFPPVEKRGPHTFAAFFPVRFKNPLDGGAPLPPDNDPKTGQPIPCAYWQRTGDTFETLTLSPSINAEDQDHGTHKGWHGHIQNGLIVGGGV